MPKLALADVSAFRFARDYVGASRPVVLKLDGNFEAATGAFLTVRKSKIREAKFA